MTRHAIIVLALRLAVAHLRLLKGHDARARGQSDGRADTI